jgi:cell division protein FtsN
MRYVIFLLIALNCAYFTWQVFLNAQEVQDERASPPLLPDVRRLVTIQEQERNEPPLPVETRKIEDLTAAQPPGAVMALSCQAIGPFLAESELKKFETRIGKLGLNVRPATRYVQEQVGYTVVLPAMEYEEALQIKRRLEKNNMTANIIGNDNMLSLGAFRDRSQAEKTLARAQALGLEPHLEPGIAKRSTYWLVSQEHDNKGDRLAGLARKYPDLRLESMACP